MASVSSSFAEAFSLMKTGQVGEMTSCPPPHAGHLGKVAVQASLLR